MGARLLMARLGAQSVRWDGIRGGGPEFTASDIAAALGMIEDEFSRELFCYLWWPDRAQSSTPDMARMLLHRVMKECKSRTMEAVVTRLTYTMAELELTSSRTPSKAVATTLERHRALMEFANDRKWPTPREKYRQLVRGVLLEMANPGVCTRCHGSGQGVHQGQHIQCPKCDGWGAVTPSDLARANRLQMTWHAYTKAWKTPYEWAVESCRDAARSAERALCRNLGYAQEHMLAVAQN
jgi:hypothetical protein